MTSNYEKYKETYSYKDLIKKYPLSENGIWAIYGEDSNCDMGGSHSMPLLEHTQGKLDDVVQYAVELPGFWQWGWGGRIDKLPVPKLIKPDAVKKRKEITEKLSAAEEEVTRLRKELKEL